MVGDDRNTCNESGQSLDFGNSGVEHYGPEKIIRVEAATVVGSGDGSKIVVDSSTLPVGRQHVQGGGSVEPVIGTEAAAVGEAIGGNRKKKLVKKMVMVKKVIKKRVPKRVLKNGSDNQGVVVKAEDVANLGEVRENLNIVNDMIGNSNVVDEVIEKDSVSEADDILSTVNDLTEVLSLVNEKSDHTEVSSLVNEKSDHVDRISEKTSITDEIMGKENITDEGTQVLKLENASDASVPIIGMGGSDVNDIAYMELDRSTLDSVANFTEKMVQANDLSGINTMEKDNINSNVVSEVDRNRFDTPYLMEVEEINNDLGTILDSKEMADTMTENQSEDFVFENEKIDNFDKVDVEHLVGQTVDPMAEKNLVLDEQENGRTIDEAESGSEVDSDRIGLTEGLLLGEETEALEQKKRRKTEIFLGGLDKDTKEDDIRKVFGEAGAIVEVRLVMSKTGKKTRGFAFVRFATAADATNAVANYSNVEICGKQCNVAPVEGNDTIFLGSVDRNWKTEDVVAMLEKAGIEKIDGVTLKADPNNIEKNRGFAFVEFLTNKDAQIAFNKLQKKDVFGKKLIKVEWAKPLTEPTEEEILRVKTVFAEYLPSSWDEEKVKNYFKRFGEIENVVLARDLPSSKGKDYAFIYYTTRDAALTCIETVNKERLEDDCSKVKMAVSLAKPVPKRKQMKHTSDLTSKQLLEPKEKAFQTSKKLHESRNKQKAASSSYGRLKANDRPSTTDELVQILRQQASNKDILLHPRTDHHFSLPGSKRPFSVVTSHQRQDPLYVERQVISRSRVESSYPLSGPSASSHGVGFLSVPYHRQGPGFGSESVNERRVYPSHFQTREQAPYRSDNNICRRYQ